MYLNIDYLRIEVAQLFNAMIVEFSNNRISGLSSSGSILFKNYADKIFWEIT